MGGLRTAYYLYLNEVDHIGQRTMWMEICAQGLDSKWVASHVK